MNVPDQPLSHEVLERARAYARVDQRAVAALPELGEAIRSFQPVPGLAGESVAEWMTDRALAEPQESTVRVRLSHGKITGVYALCAAQVALSRADRAQLGGVHYRTQPAILLAQFARAAASGCAFNRSSRLRLPVQPSAHRRSHETRAPADLSRRAQTRPRRSR